MDYDSDIYHYQIVYQHADSYYNESIQQENKLYKILELYDFNESQQKDLLAALTFIIPKEIKTLESIQNYGELLNKFDEILWNKVARNSDFERDHLIDKYKDPELQAKLLPLVNSYIQKIDDGKDEPLKVLLGTTETELRKRLDTLLNYTREGYNTEIVYSAGAQRELWLDKEPVAAKLVAKQLVKIQNISYDNALKNVQTDKEKIFKNLYQLEQQKIDNAKIKEFQNQINQEVNSARNYSVKYFTELGIKYPTETEMMIEVIKEYQDKYPELADIIFKPVIDMPKKLNNKGEMVRPDTTDNFIGLYNLYRNEIAELGSIAIVSSQPYGIYQAEQGKMIFDNKNFNCDIKILAGEMKSPNMTNIFDSIAKTIRAGLPRVLELAKKLDNDLSLNNDYWRRIYDII